MVDGWFTLTLISNILRIKEVLSAYCRLWSCVYWTKLSVFCRAQKWEIQSTMRLLMQVMRTGKYPFLRQKSIKLTKLQICVQTSNNCEYNIHWLHQRAWTGLASPLVEQLLGWQVVNQLFPGGTVFGSECWSLLIFIHFIFSSLV